MHLVTVFIEGNKRMIRVLTAAVSGWDHRSVAHHQCIVSNRLDILVHCIWHVVSEANEYGY